MLLPPRLKTCLHSFYGLLSGSKLSLLLLTLALINFIAIPVYSQTNITSVEYYIDNDPGYGNGTPLSGFTQATDVANINLAINPANVSEGLHRVYVRARNANGNWGLTNSLLFYKPYGNNTPPAAPAPPSNIVRLEYFYDIDPGYGNGNVVSITPGTDLNNVIVPFDPTLLSDGVHRFYVRAINANGNWSLTNTFLFYKPYNGGIAPPAPAPPSNITRLEYYLDDDPGIGNATSVNITPGTDIQNIVVPVDPSTVTEGIHRFYTRALNSTGKWSHTNKFLFYKPFGSGTAPAIPAPPSDITKLEYYIDDDPGIGNGTSVSIIPGTDVQNIVIPLNPSPLTEGVHRLYARARNVNGNWSLNNTFLFYKPYTQSAPPPPPVQPNLSILEYYFDTDPGYGNGMHITLPATKDTNNLNVPLDITSLALGSHIAYLRVKDAAGNWSMINSKEVLVDTVSGGAVAVGTVATTVCAGSILRIPFTANATPDSNNVFIAELSNSAGNFSNPVKIATLQGNHSDTINATIPANVAGGAGYRVRVKASSPLIISSDNGSDITINPVLSPVITVSPADTIICKGTTIKLVASSNVKSGTQLSSGVASTTALGYSGTSTICDCPSGYVAVGYSGRTGGWIDQFSLACKKLNSDGTLGSEIVFTNSNGVSTGGNPAGPYTAAGNGAFTSLTVTGNGSYLASVQGQTLPVESIANGDTTGRTLLTQLGPSNSLLGTLTVPAGNVVVGMEAFSNSYSSGVKLRHSPIVRINNSSTGLVWSTGQTTDTIEVTPSAIITYTVTASSTTSSGCTATSQKSIKVTVLNGAPATAPVITRSGRQLYASAPPDSAGVIRYNWYADGTLIPGVTGSAYFAATDATYTVSFVNPCGTGPSSAPVTISTKQDQAITFNAISDKTYGDAAFVVHATASSGLPVVYSIYNGPATVSNDTITITGAGFVTVRASQAGNGAYNFAFADRTFTVNKAAASISFTNLGKIL